MYKFANDRKSPFVARKTLLFRPVYNLFEQEYREKNNNGADEGLVREKSTKRTGHVESMFRGEGGGRRH